MAALNLSGLYLLDKQLNNMHVAKMPCPARATWYGDTIDAVGQHREQMTKTIYATYQWSNKCKSCLIIEEFRDGGGAGGTRSNRCVAPAATGSRVCHTTYQSYAHVQINITLDVDPILDYKKVGQSWPTHAACPKLQDNLQPNRARNLRKIHLIYTTHVAIKFAY